MSEPTSESIWSDPRRGFRMMWWDPIAFVVCGGAVWAGWSLLGAFTLIAPYVLANFFLFCNVFRVRRNAELLWAFAFLANAAAWLAWEPSNRALLGLMMTQTLLTTAVIAWEVRSPGYRGVRFGWFT